MSRYVAQDVVGVFGSCDVVLGFTTGDADDWKFVCKSEFELGGREEF